MIFNTDNIQKCTQVGGCTACPTGYVLNSVTGTCNYV
jgi:hypothetical protein